MRTVRAAIPEEQAGILLPVGGAAGKYGDDKNQTPNQSQVEEDLIQRRAVGLSPIPIVPSICLNGNFLAAGET